MSTSVNRPTDTAIKEKDVNQKLQLYGIYSAFSNGKVPSNKQIDIALNSALASKPLAKPSSKLSSEGRELVADVADVIEAAKKLLLSKNEGELIQEFIWDCQDLDGGNAALPTAPTDKDTARQHGNEALEGLKTLGRLILSNGQFRKLLSDATVLARDIAGDAAQSAANKVNPSEDQLSQIDQAAEDNTWHDVPDLSASGLKGQARASYDKNKPFSASEAQEAAQQGLDATQSHPSADNKQAGQAGLQQAAGNLRDKADANVPEETKENAQNARKATVQKSKNYLGKKMPQERRDQTIWRLKKMIVEIQGHSDYQEAIETLLSLAETYGSHADDLRSQSAGAVKGAHDDNNLKNAEANLKTLIERFANSTSLDDFFDALNAIYRDAQQDPELRNWFKKLDSFIRKSLQEQGYVLQDASDEEWNQIYDQGRYLLRERYRDHTNRILDEIKFVSTQFDKDPQNTAFAAAVQKLFSDLGRDENGQIVFKKHLIDDITDVIIPGIFENTRYVPIPRIEVSDPTIDLVVENLVIESDNLFPNVFEFSTDNYFRMGRKGSKGKRENKIMVAASHIQMDLRDVSYYFKKKQGFPGITDKGVMDILLHGEGFSFKLAARNAQKSDKTYFIAVDKVDVTINNLAIKIKQSNHKLLFSIAKGMVLKVLKPVIQKVLEKEIKSQFERLDAFAYGIYQDAQRAAKAAERDPENAPNIYSQYVNSFQKKMSEKKEKAKETASNTTVNLAMTKNDSIFKNISLPGGISTKATEYQDLAAKGDRWESPVYSIGSAKQSTNIPQLAPIKRKPHSTATGQVIGGNHPRASDASTAYSAGAGAGAGAAAGAAAGAYGAGSGGYGTGSSTQPPHVEPSAPSVQTAGSTFTPNVHPTTSQGQRFENQVDKAFEPNKPVGSGAGETSFYDTVTR